MNAVDCTRASNSYCLTHVPDADLMANLKGLIGRSNQLAAHVLAHLAEVEARGIHREHACSSLYAYCIYELRMSEDEAQRRIQAARTARRFPIIFSMLESAAIHLTGILLLAPHLTEENHADLLARARFRTKKEIQKLIAEVAPQPDVPACVLPLGPKPAVPRATWAAYMQALEGPIRHIPSGNGRGGAPVAPEPGVCCDETLNGPAEPASAGGEACSETAASNEAAPARDTAGPVPHASTEHALARANGRPDTPSGCTQHALARVNGRPDTPSGCTQHALARANGRPDTPSHCAEHALARVNDCSDTPSHCAEPALASLERVNAHADDNGAPKAPMKSGVDSTQAAVSAAEPVTDSGSRPPVAHRYKVQFTADQEYVDLLEEARDLLQHVVVDRDIAQVHKRAMATLVEQLRKRRRAAIERSRPSIPTPSQARDAEPARPSIPAVHAAEPRASLTADSSRHEQPPNTPSTRLSPPPSGRHVPAVVVRTVWERDGARCTFVDSRGQRCRETAGLELHHREPYFRRGAATAENLALYCRAHNALEAERELGQEYVARRKSQARVN